MGDGRWELGVGFDRAAYLVTYCGTLHFIAALLTSDRALVLVNRTICC